MNVDLPAWASASATALGALEAEQFGLVLQASLDASRANELLADNARLSERIAKLRLDVGGEPPVVAMVFDAAIKRSAIPGVIGHLLEAREQLRTRRLEQADLRIVQHAIVAPLPPPHRRGLWAAVFGAAVGMLAALLNRLGRPVETKHRDGPTLEAHVHVPVIGSIAAPLADYGERKLRPLAQSHPQHLAVDGVRSLETAFKVLAAGKEQPGPIVMVNVDERQNAGHILANLAMLAALRGERVLLIETAQGESVLSSMFVSGTQTTLSTIMDVGELCDEKLPKHDDGGRIRYVVADDVGSPDPPVPGAFMQYFSRIYISSNSIDRAITLLQAYGDGIGVLVGSDQLPIREWQRARAQWRESQLPLDGLVHCGHRINERHYAAETI